MLKRLKLAEWVGFRIVKTALQFLHAFPLPRIRRMFVRDIRA